MKNEKLESLKASMDAFSAAVDRMQYAVQKWGQVSEDLICEIPTAGGAVQVRLLLTVTLMNPEFPNLRRDDRRVID